MDTIHAYKSCGICHLITSHRKEIDRFRLAFHVINTPIYSKKIAGDTFQHIWYVMVLQYQMIMKTFFSIRVGYRINILKESGYRDEYAVVRVVSHIFCWMFPILVTFFSCNVIGRIFIMLFSKQRTSYLWPPPSHHNINEKAVLHIKI